MSAVEAIRVLSSSDECAMEPIHLPGSIQPHAVVIVLHDGIIVQASQNSTTLFGAGGQVAETLAGRTLADLVGIDTADQLIGRVGSPTAQPQRPRSSRFVLGDKTVDITVVDVAGQRGFDDDVRIVQFEPVTSDDTGEVNFAAEITDAMMRIQAADSSEAVVDEVCGFVKSLTGFDRVMAYRFEADDHGIVIAEHREPTLDPFLGLHYPESDIPAQARAMYVSQWLRIIPDARYRPSPLIPRTLPDGRSPDLSGITSRSVSPVHCEYLANMGVLASMSISVVVGGRLWGLIACHHYLDTRLPSTPVREACEFVALAASVMISSRLAEERTARALTAESLRRRLGEHLSNSDDVTLGLTADPHLLLALADASGVAIVFRGAVTLTGHTPDAETVLATVAEIAATHPGVVFSTDCTAEHHPSLVAHGDSAAGLLAMPISSLHRNYVVWFRPEQRIEVRWAGEPTKAIRASPDGSRHLSPRESFEAWSEAVEGRSRPWSAEHIAAIESVRDLVAGHITQTVEKMAKLNADLARSNAELDAFAYIGAHDLQEPLRSLANHANFLVEDYTDVLDDNGLQRLETISNLADRMAGMIRGLLDNARLGRSELDIETVRLASIVDDVSELLSGRLDVSGTRLELVTDAEILVDRDMITHVVMNLVSNAIKYNVSAEPHVQIGSAALSTTARGADLISQSLVGETAQRVVYVRDNGIGIPAHELESIFGVFHRLHEPDEYGGGSGAGLAIARRIVQRHGGSLWAESQLGAGTTFYFSTGPAA